MVKIVKKSRKSFKIRKISQNRGAPGHSPLYMRKIREKRAKNGENCKNRVKFVEGMRVAHARGFPPPFSPYNSKNREIAEKSCDFWEILSW